LNEIKAHRLVALNQFLMYGTYVHYHKYARPGARLFRKRAIPKSGTGSVPSYPEYSLDKEKMLEDSGWEEVGIVGEEKGSKLTVKDLTDFEVDWDGFSMKDLNTYQFDGGDVYIHRVKPIDHISNPDGSREPLLIDNVVDHPNMLIPLNSQVTAWEYFIRDIRTGMFHPKSRTLQDYAQKHARREPYRTDVVQSFGAPTEGGNPAFDMEALKDPGGFKYWGLKNANTISEDQMKNASPINPYPTLSIQGLSSYIGDYLFNLADTAQREQAKNFVFDRGGRGNMFTRDIEKKKE